MTADKKPGVGVDAQGDPDPTANVMSLVEAANKRQDDLRDLNNRYLEARIEHVEQVSQIREAHAKEIRQLDSDRLKSIREVDVLAENTSSERALEAIKTLAAVTATSAETLRVSVAQTATTIAAQLDQRLGAVIGRVESLEKSSYTGAGRQAVADPALVELAASIRRLEESRSHVSGRSEGMSDSAKLLIGALGLISTLLGFYTLTQRQGASTQPQVVYVPAPATGVPSSPDVAPPTGR